MRRDGYDFERFLNITINPANISGYVFNDTNYDKVYNESIDDTIPDLTLAFFEITGFSEDMVDLDQDNGTIITANETGYYNTSGLLPGIYRVIIADEKGFRYHLNDVALYQGNNTYNAINPQEADLEGIVYYDENDNLEYDSGDILISDADVKLEHIIRNDENDIIQENVVRTTKTSANGSYSFKSLIPGTINNRDLNDYRLTINQAEEGYQEIIEKVRIIENETNIFNVSVGFTPIVVSGTVTHDGTPIEGVDISFEPDETVEYNTAVEDSASTAENGSYEISLVPGSYNISIKKVEKTVIVYSTEDEKITIVRGQQPESRNFVLEKKSATVSGSTSSEGLNIENITISFEEESGLPHIQPKSKEGGFYSIELSLGNYTVTVNQQIRENNQTYTYTFTGSLEIKTVPSDITYNIEMAKEAKG